MLQKKTPAKEIFINRVKDIVKCDNKRCFNNAEYSIRIIKQEVKLCDSCLRIIQGKLFENDFKTKQTKLDKE